MENNVILKKQLCGYYRKIRRLLLCKKQVKNKILTDLKTNIAFYIEENPEADFSQIVRHFGEPQKIAEDFAADAGIDYAKRLKQKRVILAVIIFLLTVIATSAIVVAAIAIWVVNHDVAYYYDVELIDNGIVYSEESY